MSVEQSNPVTRVGLEDESTLIEDVTSDSQASGVAVECDDSEVRMEAREPHCGQGIPAADVEKGSGFGDVVVEGLEQGVPAHLAAHPESYGRRKVRIAGEHALPMSRGPGRSFRWNPRPMGDFSRDQDAWNLGDGGGQATECAGAGH